MAHPPLALTLLPGPPVVPGAVVRGTVEVLEDLPRAHHLEVALELGGRRSPVSEVGRQTPALGPFTRGQRVAFELQVPADATLSYEGEEISCEWQVLARADVPWAVDPVVREPLLVVPRVVRDEAERAAVFRALDAVATPGLSTAVQTILVVVVLGLLLPSLLMLSPVLVPVALAVWAKRGLIRTRLRAFDLDVPDRAMLGDALPALVRFELRRPIEVESISVVLEGKEHWTTGSGKNRQHHVRVVHRQEAKLVGPSVLAPTGVEPGGFVGRAVLQLPAGGPATSAGDRTLWEVTARAWLVGWPDPIKAVKVHVASARGASPAPPMPETPETTSIGVAFVPRGAPAPPGVDVSTAGAAIWPWLLLPFAGSALVALDLVLWAALRVDSARALTAAGVFMLVVGVAGTVWKLVR